MRRTSILLATGVLAVACQGALSGFFPVALVPDASLLFSVAAALLLGPAEALCVAALLGLSSDLLSGALLGQAAFLRVFEVGITRVVSAQIDLRRAFPLCVFVLALSVFDALGMAGLLRILQGNFGLGLDAAGLLPHLGRIVSNGLFAPVFAWVARALAEGVDDQSRRELRLDTRRSGL